jgi:hypothetical protein
MVSSLIGVPIFAFGVVLYQKATEDNWEHSGCGRRMFSGARLNRSIKFSSMSRARPLILRSDGPDRRFQFHKRSQLFIRNTTKRRVVAMRVSNPDCSSHGIDG